MSHAGQSGEIAAAQVRALQETIKEFNEDSKKQTSEMLRLTDQIKWLTTAMFIVGVVQLVKLFF